MKTFFTLTITSTVGLCQCCVGVSVMVLIYFIVGQAQCTSSGLRWGVHCSIFCLITGPEQQLSGESEDDIGLNTQHCTESAAGREVRRGRLALCSHRLCERASGRVAAILAARPGARGGAAGGDAGWLSHCRAAQPVSDIRLHCWWEGRGWRWRRGSVASGGTAGRRDQSSARAGRSST